MTTGTRVEKSWGYEEIIYNGDYCCKKLVYARRIASSLHFHPIKHETFVVQSGIFSIYAENRGRDWVRMYPGDSVVIPPNTKHRVECLMPGTIVESSTHDDPSDCIRLIPSEA